MSLCMTEFDQMPNMNSFGYAHGNRAPAVSISRYGTRHWAVWLDGELLAVTVYLKGARAVACTLMRLLSRNGEKEYQTVQAA